MKRTWTALAALAVLSSACGAELSPPEPAGDGLGVVELTLTSAPASVKCLSIFAIGSAESGYSKLINIAPTGSFTLTGLPKSGPLHLGGNAYDAACDALTNQSPTWIADSETIDLHIGVVGRASLTFRHAPKVTGTIDFEDTITSLHLGKTQAFATLADGAVRAWGINNAGQLGDGSKVPKLVPTVVDLLKGLPPAPGIVIAQVSSRSSVSCAIAALGSQTAARCWGSNESGQVGDGTTTPRLEPVTINTGAGMPRQVSTGSFHACALVANGVFSQVRCWGSNSAGQLGLGTTGGSQTTPQLLTGFPAQANIAEIVSGQDHNCVRYGSGNVECWGKNDSGQCGLGASPPPGPKTAPNSTPISNLSAIAKITAGDNHTCALRTDGALFCWGRNDMGQIGVGGSGAITLPTMIMDDVIDVAAGIGHTCAVRGDHTVHCWGAAGTLGNNTANQSSAPTQVTGIDDAVALAAGSATCAIRENGGAVCWGPNSEGLLGVGDLIWRFLPTALLF